MCALVGETLKIPASDIDPTAPLEAYGIDSILVVKLANRFREVFDNITSTLFFEYQTIDALVRHLLETREEALITLVGADAGGQHQHTYDGSRGDGLRSLSPRERAGGEGPSGVRGNAPHPNPLPEGEGTEEPKSTSARSCQSH